MLFNLTSPAQNATVDFRVDSNQINISGVDVPILSTILKSGDIITWNQENQGNSATTNFEIQSFTGSWDDASSTGDITYILDSEGFPCTLRLFTIDSNVILIMTFQPGDDNQQIFKFLNNSITYP